MNTLLTAREFLFRHHMHPEQLCPGDIVPAFMEEMRRGSAGLPSSLGMFPAYINASSAPADGRVLVIDAGGTNLRLARLSFENGRLSVEAVKKRFMPGTGERINAEEFFRTLAHELLPLCEDVERACFCFSYPCEILPDGDGLPVRLTKELFVEGLPGKPLCASLERELIRQGAVGRRHWRVINDTVGAMLAGMVQAEGIYDDYVGFILGTGFNICCNVSSSLLTKVPNSLDFGDSSIVNLESGGFHLFLRGDADQRMDEKSESPGAQQAEKCISGAYQAALLKETLLLAAEDGLFSSVGVPAISSLSLTSADISALALENSEMLFPALPEGDYALLKELNRLLLERAALLSASLLAGTILSRQLPSKSRVCICADGTTFALNPLLKPRTKANLDALLHSSGISAAFYQVSDATLLGTAYAALLP